MENGKRRRRRLLSPQEKWEVFLEVTSQSSRRPTRLGSGTST
jgi:hypothetical protein